MSPQTVTLEQMLYARERRAAIQNKMLEEAPVGACLVCLTMNIAGEIKRTPMTVTLFERGMAEFSSLGYDVADRIVIDEITGSEAFWLVRDDGAGVKKRLEAVEDSFPAARLFDFDVLVRDTDDIGAQDNAPARITKLSRAVSRSCLICGRPAADCARSRRHGLDAVKAATGTLLREFCAETLAERACGALLEELYTTPKPGLVDLANCGAHTDMDVPLFEKSTESLRPYFTDAALLGMEGCSMEALRMRGLEAEKAMFAATGGVNTHKGMIYSMGLLIAGAGRALTDAGGNENTETVSAAAAAVRFAAELAGQDAEMQIGRSLDKPVTNGGKALKEHGARGATGEAAAGFPHAVYCASRLAHYMKNGVSGEMAGALAFCDCMAQLEDTNLLHRGGKKGLTFVRQEASRISSIPDYGDRIDELRALDRELIRRHLSPGGSADMLALAFFLTRA